VLLAGRKPHQRLRQDLIAIAAQPFDVDPVADYGDDPVTAIASRVLQEFNVVGGKSASYQSRLHHAREQIRSDKPATSHLQ
jgi:hypothetical protein